MARIKSPNVASQSQCGIKFIFSTLAGSTVMLLTIAWSLSVAFGKCDLNERGEAIEQKDVAKFSLTKKVRSTVSNVLL